MEASTETEWGASIVNSQAKCAHLCYICLTGLVLNSTRDTALPVIILNNVTTEKND